MPTLMPNLWGKHLGVIGLHLNWDGAHWVIDKRQTTVGARGAQQADRQEADEPVRPGEPYNASVW